MSEVSPVKKTSKKTVMGAKKPSIKRPSATTKSGHPPTGEMVDSAIAALKDKKGSSLQAIKKYMAGRYMVDVEKLSFYIKKYLKTAIEKKSIVQTKGIGATGRFRLAVIKSEGKKKKKPTTPKPKSAGVKKTGATDAKKTAVKKPVAAKKAATTGDKKKPVTVAKKPAAAKKPTAVKKPAVAKKPVAEKKTPAKTTKVPAAAKPKKIGKAPRKIGKAATKPKSPKPIKKL